jgi:hypothetical protein
MSRVIIITGMGRSGTSLVTSLVQRAGIHVGEKLLAASSANPRGYFEDVDFFEYHDQVLHSRGQTYLHVSRNFTFEPTPPEMEHAERLIAERIHRPVWGWKDPRTSLFLDFWIKLIPDARFLFVYRHPIEVLLSLLRRGEFESHPTFMAGLNAWHTYNTNLLNVCHRFPDRCLLVHIDGVTEHPSQFTQLLREKLQLDPCLDAEAFEQVYHANELQKTSIPPDLTATLAKVFPELLELYQRLNQQAELRGDKFPADSTASGRFSTLAHFADSLADPVSLPVKHSMLQLLLWHLAPEPTEKILRSFNQSTKEAQLKIDQHWFHAQHLHRLSVEQQQELDSRSAQIAVQLHELERRSVQIAEQQQELERLLKLEVIQREELEQLKQLNVQQAQTLDGLQWLNLEQCQELERRSDKIESLAAELDNIYGTPVGKVLRSYRNFRDRRKKVA